MGNPIDMKALCDIQGKGNRVIEQGTLMIETLRLLRERGRNQTLLSISQATGIQFYWLRKFCGKEIRDPSVNRIQKLYEYLSGKKLLDGVKAA